MDNTFWLNVLAGIISGVAVALVTRNFASGAGSTVIVIVVTAIIPGPVDEALIAGLPVLLGATSLFEKKDD